MSNSVNKNDECWEDLVRYLENARIESTQMEIVEDTRIEILQTVFRKYGSAMDDPSMQKIYLMRLDSILSEYSSFITAPASTKFHGSTPGGLFWHSLAVYEAALKCAKIYNLNDCSEVDPFACIFHDICKTDAYISYKDENRKIRYKYDEHYDERTVGHGAESVIRLLKIHPHIFLNKNWELAVYYHMGVFDVTQNEMKRFSKCTETTKEVLLLHHADMIASKIYHL